MDLLIGKIYFCLVAAIVLGFVVGWLFFRARRDEILANMQTIIEESDREIREQRTMIDEQKLRYAGLVQEFNDTRAALLESEKQMDEKIEMQKVYEEKIAELEGQLVASKESRTPEPTTFLPERIETGGEKMQNLIRMIKKLFKFN
jgi:septal ring factor EnvC (AmiA/AmiB activator)